MSPDAKSSPNLPSLTGVRGVAALWVLVFHVHLIADVLGWPGIASLPVIRTGWAGVDMFFVLSGFILMLVHERDFQGFDLPPLLRFAWLRFFRVYPLATVVLLMLLALALLDREFAAFWTVGAWPRNFTVSAFFRTLFLATRWWAPPDGDWNQPEWSLSVEILGYVAFPMLAVMATRLSNRTVLIGLAAICLVFPTVVAFLYKGKLYNDDLFWGAGIRMAGAFTGGVVLARLHKLTPAGFRVTQGQIADAALVTILALLLLPPYGYGLLTLAFGALVYGLASDQGTANRLFASPLAFWLGRISFPLYLIHVMALSWLQYELNLSTASFIEKVAAAGFMLTLIFCTAWLLHLLVETPTHRFARRFASKATFAMSGLGDPVAQQDRAQDS